MPDPADPSLEAALRILDELEPLARESGPVTVSAEYLADVARAEALPRNRAGADKASFDFEQVWEERRVFKVGAVDVPVARLTHIVQSKAAVGRPKDRLFLATHADALRQLFGPRD